jgi:hypothetical protein
MKRALFFSLFSAVCLAAIGQGKVTLCNDSGCLYTLLSRASGPIPTSGPLPGGVVLAVGLYGGTSSSTLTLQKKVLLNPPGGTGMPDGWIPNTHVICSFPGGSVAYFQVVVWDSAYPDPDGSWRNSYVQGNNNIFTMIPGTSLLYPLITTSSNSTWAAAGNETPLSVFVASRVPIRSVAISGGNFVLSWAAFGYPQLYILQYKTNLAQSDWMGLGNNPIEGTNVVFSFADPIQTGGPQRFYRVLWLPF